MLRALASHLYDLGSIPGPHVTCGLSLLLVLALAPRVFLRVLRFSSLLKNQHSKFQFDPEMRATGLSALLLVSRSLNKVILGGGFYCPLSKTDKVGGCDVSSRKKCCQWDRVVHVCFRFRRSVENATSGRNLIYLAVIARHLLQKSRVQKCDIKHDARCDHSLVTIRTN